MLRKIKINVDDSIPALTLDEKELFISFCSSHTEIDKTVPYRYKAPNNQIIQFTFNASMIKKIQQSENGVNHFYVYDGFIGGGAFGEVYNGVGKLKIENNNLTFSKAPSCDFIYVRPQAACELSLDAIVSECKYKTSYIMLNHQAIFYLDRKYSPSTALHYVTDLSKEKASAMLDKHGFHPNGADIQSQPLAADEFSYFSNHHTATAADKNFIIKTQMQSTHADPGLEADLARKTPHLSHTKGPFYSANGLVSYIKQDKKPGVTLEKIIFDDAYETRKLTYQERIQLTLALFSALKTQVHDKGITHRDLKTSNILVDLLTMTVSVIDFGGCKETHSHPLKENVGTIRYASPECCLNHDVAPKKRTLA